MRYTNALGESEKMQCLVSHEAISISSIFKMGPSSNYKY